MAINGSKPYEIDGKKYSFAFQDGKLLGANQIDASGDLVSSADLNAPIFQTEAAQNSIREAYNVNKNGSNTNNNVENFSGVEQSTDAEKSAYSDLQTKKLSNEQFIQTDQVDSLAQARPGEEEFYSDPRFNYDYKGSDIMSCLLYTSPSPRD